MRRRLLTSTLAVVAVAVLALGLPLLVVTARLVEDAARNDLLRQVQVVAAYAEDRLDGAGLSADRLARLVPAGEQVRVRLPTGQTVLAGPPIADPTSATAPLRGGGEVRVSRSVGEVRRRQAGAALAIGAAAVVSMLLAALVAVFSARRLADPLRDVADRAARLGSGDFRPAPGRHGIPELDRVSDVLDRSARAIADLIRRERDLASDVSHQLRTRLTALRMRLEEITRSADPAVRGEALAALEQTERLSGVVDELLAQARRARADDARDIDVAREVAELVRERDPTVRRLAREVVVDAEPGLVARAGAGRLHQAVGVLVDNALEHGAGRVTVGVRRSARHAVVEVADEGAGVPEEMAGRLFERGVSGAGGTGIGLALARALVETDGGRLELRNARPAVFVVYLPLAES